MADELPDNGRLELDMFVNYVRGIHGISRPHGHARYPPGGRHLRALTPEKSACPWTERVQLSVVGRRVCVRDVGAVAQSIGGGQVRNRFGRLTAMMVGYKITYPDGKIYIGQGPN
jgi:hypothetical protein